MLFLSPQILVKDILERFRELSSYLEAFRVGKVTILHEFAPAPLIESRTNHINQRFDVFVLTEGRGCEPDLDMCHERVSDEGVARSREPLSFVKDDEAPRHQFHPLVLYFNLFFALFSVSTSQLGF